MIDTCRIGDSSRDYPRRQHRARANRLRAIKRTSWRCFLALSFARAASHVPPRLQRVGLVCRAHMSTACTCSRAPTHTCVDTRVRSTRGWTRTARFCRGTDLLRGRPGSCPTLSRYTIIFFVVCALVSPRERYRPFFFSSPPRPPTLLSLDRCCGRVFRPSFIRVSSPFVNSTP